MGTLDLFSSYKLLKDLLCFSLLVQKEHRHRLSIATDVFSFFLAIIHLFAIKIILKFHC